MIDTDARYRVPRWNTAVALWVDEMCPEHDNCVKVVMVGDDHRHHVDVDDLEKIGEGDYCSSCGQIGCGW